MSNWGKQLRFQRRHYEAIAEVLRVADGQPETMESEIRLQTIREITRELSDMFARDNPNFDRERFALASVSFHRRKWQENRLVVAE